MLHPSFLENAAFAALVRVPEFPGSNVGDDLVVLMGMERPDCAGCQRVIIKDAKLSKIFKSGIKVIAEGEMPSSVEVSVLDLAIDLIYVFGITNLYHGLPPFP